MKTFLQKILSEIFILAGCGLVIYATWQLSWIAAVYVTGGILILFGVLIGIVNGLSSKAQRSEVKSDH